MARGSECKEGIVVVLDVGRGVCAGAEPTFFTRAKDCLRFILQRKIFADKCYDVVGVVTFGTAGTNNQLATGNQYEHVTVLQEVRLVDWDMMKQVENQGCGGSSGDWLDALVVAMDLLHDPDGKRFTGKKIVLLTDFSGEFSDDQSTAITSGLLNEGIELVVIGPDILRDLNEEEDGDAKQPGTSDGNDSSSPKKPSLSWNGKPKTMVQMAGEAVVARIVEKVDGMLCSFEDALPQLMFFEKKKQASASWNTTLDIGADFKIAITGKIKVRDVSLPTWKKTYSGDPSAVINKEVSYHLYDEKQTAVPEEEVIDGYFYGTTLVPVSDEDMKMAYKSKSPRSMSLLGFTETKNVPHWIRAGNQVLVVTARDNDDGAAVALSALIQAMVEMDMVAITRRVYSQNLNPRLGALFPEITKDHECLLWIQLPFIQDVERLTFPSLQPRLDKLKQEEKDAIDSLIDAMDLSHVKGEDDDEEEEDILDPTTVLNPQIQHFYNVLTHRALNPGGKLPEPAPHILKILEVPEKVCEARDKVAATLKKLFPTQAPVASKRSQNVFDVEDKKDGGEKRAKVDDSLSASDLVQHQVTQVTTASPVKDFMALLRGDAPNFNDICRQMGDVILQLMDSLAGASSGPVAAAMQDKVLECLTTFRQESQSIDPATFNTFLTSRFKDVVISLSVKDLWDRMKEGNLGLITVEENGRSSVSKEEASTFLQLDQGKQEAPPPVQEAGDEMEDLLDDL
ncbi:X-ray repair cross-complementing protein 5-like isoform X2 [Portunus trituberculatus]|uniref:X-ray repair cross-complementing protein 5-like isoform X2 n=1 Tax=Portunus trituberculatus TaxID=210409 RepID=UPI001E1D1FD8|nr:X-ray repair cross-complementing protein 5-like isoform X2 [Portunus trituberculatus]